MKCLRLSSMFFATFVICSCLSITCSAEELEDSSEDFGDDVDTPVQVLEVPTYDTENPLPVVIVDGEEQPYSVAPYDAGGPVLVIGDTPPDDLLFNGAGWITGTDSNLGKITLYFPISYREGYWGTDSNGHLYNVSSSSVSGYLSGVYNNSVTASGLSYPRYRLSSSSSAYTTLYLTPEDSNMDIAVANAPKYTVYDFMPYLILLMGGVLILCFMRR